MISTPFSYHVVDSQDYEEIREITTENLGPHMRREIEGKMEDGISWADAIYDAASVEPSDPPQDNILNKERPTLSTYLEEARDGIETITEAVEASEVN